MTDSTKNIPESETDGAQPLGSAGPHFNLESVVGTEEYPAWEEVAAGRYMPRRVRGSCAGRALG